MTKEDVIKMAREAGLLPSDSTFGYGAEVADLSRFAALVAASEREACAKVCDKYYEAACRFESEHRTHHYLMGKGAAVCAYKIRARGNV